MLEHRGLRAFLFTILALFLAGCGTTPSLVSIQISPTTQLFAGSGLTAQFTAIGTYKQGDHPETQQDITNLVTWKSSGVSVASISPTGVATSAGLGTTVITASMNGGLLGLVTSNNASVTVCQAINPSNQTQCASAP